MPASSQQSPTSATRATDEPQPGQRTATASIHGRWSSSSASTAAGSTASARSSAREPTTVSRPQSPHG